MSYARLEGTAPEDMNERKEPLLRVNGDVPLWPVQSRPRAISGGSDMEEGMEYYLENFAMKAQGYDPNQKIFGLTKFSFIKTMQDCAEVIRHQRRRIKELEGQLKGMADDRLAKYAIIKDSHHWYCGVCHKRIPLKKKPKYCLKCGSKIKDFED